MSIRGEQAKDNAQLISQFHAMTDATVTIFQMIPEGLLRVATNVKISMELLLWELISRQRHLFIRALAKGSVMGDWLSW